MADCYTQLNQAMLRLAAEPRAMFVGQSVLFGGTAMHRDLEGVPDEQRIEFPVAEDLQLGFCTGLAMQGFLPICIFPRMDFMLRAMDQLVNHLDKMEEMSCVQYRAGVIIRTRVGSKYPLDAGPQHTNEYLSAFRAMVNFPVVELRKHDDPEKIYLRAADAAKDGIPVMVVEDFNDIVQRRFSS